MILTRKGTLDRLIGQQLNRRYEAFPAQGDDQNSIKREPDMERKISKCMKCQRLQLYMCNLDV